MYYVTLIVFKFLGPFIQKVYTLNMSTSFMRKAEGVSGLCHLLLKHFSFLYIKTLLYDSHIENLHPIFCADLIIYF